MIGGKRGFFFLLTTFFIISYAFLYLNLWLDAWRADTRAMTYQLGDFPSPLELWLDNSTLERFYATAGKHALFVINNWSIDHPLRYDSSNETRFLGEAFVQLLRDGQASGVTQDSSEIRFSSEEKDRYSFAGFVQALNASLKPYGMHVSRFDLKLRNFSFVDPVSFNASCDLMIRVISSDGSFNLTRTVRLTKVFNVSGFVDPFIARESKKLGISKNGGFPEKQIFYRSVKLSELEPKRISFCKGSQKCRKKSMAGWGFFYGPVVDVSHASMVPKYDRHRYILYGSYNDIINFPDYQDFGALLINTSPTYTPTSCSSDPAESATFNAIQYIGHSCTMKVDNVWLKPFAVVPGLKLSELPSTRAYNHASHAVLIIGKENASAGDPDEKYKGVKLYDIEAFRDFVNCGYYINSSLGMSYPQRLAGVLSTSPYGLITTVVGRWAGGAYFPNMDQYSRIDVDFFHRQQGEIIRGLAGCKSYEDCSGVADAQHPLGHFRLSSQFMKLFEVEDKIDCRDGWAPCQG